MEGLACIDCLSVAEDIAVDRTAPRVLWHHLWIELSPTQYGALLYLAEHRGIPVPAEELGAAIWSAAAPHLRRKVQTLVRRLRAKLERDPAHPRVILTVVAEGYLIPA